MRRSMRRLLIFGGALVAAVVWTSMNWEDVTPNWEDISDAWEG